MCILSCLVVDLEKVGDTRWYEFLFSDRDGADGRVLADCKFCSYTLVCKWGVGAVSDK